MSTPTQCPECLRVFKVHEKHLGRKARCWCGCVFVVEGYEEPPSPEVDAGLGMNGALNESDFWLEVVGESAYQENIEFICHGRIEGMAQRIEHAVLVPEPENIHDANAVAVYICDLLVGYLSRDHAKIFHRSIHVLTERDGPVVCLALITGGWDRGPDDRGYYGVKLDWEPPGGRP